MTAGVETLRRVHVPLGERAYDVLVGPGLIADAARHVAPLLARPRVAVITDETVARHHLGPLRAALEGAAIAVSALGLPAGEATKSWPHLTRDVE